MMKINTNPRIAIAGAVNSSLRTLEKLIEHRCNICAVLALNPLKATNVSGYNNLKLTADENNLPSIYFDNINDNEVYEFLEDKEIDLFFVVGLSQIVKKRLLSLSRYGCIGFHPTRLPEGRGRGAVAWLILGKAPGAASFFLMDEGMDSGKIISQKEFEVDKNDYAQDVINKILESSSLALDDFLPKLNKGIIDSQTQNESEATFLGRRKPVDGLINWRNTNEEIYALIRASSNPFPGAFTFFNDEKVIVQKAKLEKIKYIGVPGRIVKVDNNNILVTTADGALWLVDVVEEYPTLKFKAEQDFE